MQTPKPDRHQRRKALLALAGLGAFTSLPQSWRRPVIDSVVLPAHAQTSVTPAANTGSEVNEPEVPDDSSAVQDPPEAGVLRGLVASAETKKDEGGPFAGAQVFITSMDGPGEYNTITNEGGSFTVDVPAGRYALVVEAADHFTWSSFPDVITVNPGETVTENISILPSS